MKPLLTAIREGRLYLDGGMGSMLQAAGLPEGRLPDVWGVENPQAVQAIHRAYLEAGCRLITTNTFGTTAPKVEPYGHTVAQVMSAAVANVRAAMDQAGVTDAYVCADIGPTGKLLRPYGDLDFEEAVARFAAPIRAAEEAGADCILIETMSDLYEMKAAVVAAKENCSLPPAAPPRPQWPCWKGWEWTSSASTAAWGPRRWPRYSASCGRPPRSPSSSSPTQACPGVRGERPSTT